MPAGFNKGQIEYIKTIANVNGHKTYKATCNSTDERTVTAGLSAVCDTKTKYAIWCLGGRPVSVPAGDRTKTTDLTQDATITPLDVYTVAINENHVAADPEQRVSPECFLESVSCKMRHIMDLDGTIDAQTHKEFRLIVFRHREKQHDVAQFATNYSNPLYDMFFGAKASKYGPKGYRNRMDHEGNLNYTAWEEYKANYDTDAMMTDKVNTADYVVMKDCRYYLGREYGGKHIYEDQFSWDHEDPIATDLPDLSTTDSEKNYHWYIMLLGNNNVTSGATSSKIDNLGFIRFQTNTHLTSG